VTLLIACLLMAQTDAGAWSYVGVTLLWVAHLAYHGDAP
jgi:hypothetical protein